MTNYLARSALVLLLSLPAFSSGGFIAPRAAAVPGGVVTFKLNSPPCPTTGGTYTNKKGTKFTVG